MRTNPFRAVGHVNSVPFNPRLQATRMKPRALELERYGAKSVGGI
jgi:hypothetical protein